MHEPLVFFNGEFMPKSEACVSVFDHGILYGDGIFEGIKSWDGKVFKLKEHIERFYDSARFLMIKLVRTPDQMADVVLNTLAINGFQTGVGYVRLVATRGPGDLGINPRKCYDRPTVFCIAASIQLYPEEYYETGMKVITCSTRRNSVASLPGRVKSLNYINNILGAIEYNNAGAQEGIMLTHDGYVSECTADNIFFISDNVIKTPAKHLGLLEGVTRNSVIEIAQREGYKVEEGIYHSYDLYTASEVWLTGTGADLVPVVEIDSRIIGDGRPGKVFRQLRSLWQDYVSEPQNHSLVPSRESVMASL